MHFSPVLACRLKLFSLVLLITVFFTALLLPSHNEAKHHGADDDECSALHFEVANMD